MSGIAGIVHFDGRPVEAGLIQGMTAAMANRGPDAISHWSAQTVALGHCMLRTTPESLDEKQPLANEEESIVLVLDGRLDNWEELRVDFLGRGVRLGDKTDAELVLRAYEIWGTDCLSQIEGDFAFVVWDARKRSVFCACNQTGIKTLHFHQDEQRFVFASEPGPISQLPGVPEVFNEELVAEYLSIDWQSLDQTFWKVFSRPTLMPRCGPRLSNRSSPGYFSASRAPPMKRPAKCMSIHAEDQPLTGQVLGQPSPVCFLQLLRLISMLVYGDIFYATSSWGPNLEVGTQNICD